MSADVERIYTDTAEVSALLLERQEISLLTTADSVRSKSLLLAAASYFETTLSQCVRSFCAARLGYPSAICELVEAKAITRQYHTWFDWKGPSAGPFFALFGKGFSKFMKDRLKEDDQLSKMISDFLQIGSDRNRLVHQDFASFALEATADEIYQRYRNALGFVKAVPALLEEYDNAVRAAALAASEPKPEPEALGMQEDTQ